jgi:hypothetical protein
LTAGAQHVATVAGVVQRNDAGTLRPVPGVWVVLHRVGRDTAAPVDSTRTDARGRYRMQHEARRDSAVFFASTVFGGVAYFTVPARGGDTTAANGELTVFDTSSAGEPVRTRGRHVIVSSPDPDGRRAIAEVFELENAGATTRVAGRGASWSTELPSAAQDVRVEQGDVQPDAVAVREGRIDVLAPFPPGLRQVAFSYAVGPDAFPLAIPVPDSTTVLEVLIEGAGGVSDGAGLLREDSVTLQGRTYQRFLARNVVPGVSFSVDVSAGGPRTVNITVVISVGLLGIVLLLAVARAALGARAAPSRSSRESADRLAAATAQRLASKIAQLDSGFERRRNPSADERAAYEAKRDALKRELTEVLAERDEQL